MKIADLQQENCENDSKIQNIIESIRADVCQNLVDVKATLEVPLSIFFTAFKEDDYYGKGEENLRTWGKCQEDTKGKRYNMNSIKEFSVLMSWFSTPLPSP